MTNKGKLSKWNQSRGKMAADLQDVVFRARSEYRNSGVPAFSEESHIIHQKLEYAFDVIAEQSKTIAEQQMQINKLENMLMKAMRMGIKEEVITEEETTTIEITVTRKKSKWDKDSIFRAFDHYRREKGHFGPITPEIVRDNWSSLMVNCPHYVGMTLGKVLKEYASERGMTY